VGQFAVAALYERRNLLNQKPAVIDRRYKKIKVTHYPSIKSLGNPAPFLIILLDSVRFHIPRRPGCAGHGFSAWLRKLRSDPRQQVGLERLEAFANLREQEGWLSMIEVENLTKRYGPTLAVSEVSFNVQKGEVLGFLGPNGAGKTTTMRVITGFLPPTQGKVRVAGYDVTEEPLEAKRRTGYLPENPPVYPDMTVDEYLTFVARIKGVPRRDVRKRLNEVVEKCAVTEVRRRQIGKLSKGYRQRVGLAQALIHNPDVLVLDEPTAGLDPKQIIETRELIKGLAGQHTVVLSTHILPEVSKTCQRVVVINAGLIVAVGTPDELTRRLQGFETVLITVEGPAAEIMDKFQRVGGVNWVEPRDSSQGRVTLEVNSEKDKDVRAELAQAVVESGWKLFELKTSGLSLEDIFLKLTTKDLSEEAAAGALKAAN
jgi:ABC-2 type transport system ATP-binding protein